MMHYEETVVTLVDDNKKPIREYDSVKQEKGRKCKVLLPFDSEYKLLVKNNSDRRIKLEIEIDGTIVSGNGLIIDKHTTDYIERFVDVAKKFKFVKAGNEAVADPTNKENGLIKVRVAKEKKYVPPVVIKEEHHHHHWDWWRPYGGQPIWYTSHTTYGGPLGSAGGVAPGDNVFYSASNDAGNNDAIGSVLRGGEVKGLTPPADQHVYMNQVQASMPLGEAGATIEGSKSNQVFEMTTWNGDDEISYFTFHLSGQDLKADPEYLKFLELKKKYEA